MSQNTSSPGSPLFARVSLVLALVVGLASVGSGIYFGVTNRGARGPANPHSFQAMVKAPSGPCVRFERTEVDFGTMWPYAKKEILVPFRNSGDETLLVERVRSGCACLLASTASREIAGGQSGAVKLTLIAEAKPGQSHYPTFVESNDPGNSVVKLTSVVVVDSGVSADPATLDTAVVPGSHFEHVIQLRLKKGHMKVSRIESTCRALAVELVRRTDDEFTISVRGTLDSTPLLEGMLHLFAEEVTEPILKIPVHIRAAAPTAYR